MTVTQTASRLLAKEGEPVVLSYTTAEVRDPATGEIVTPGSTVTVDGNGYPCGYRSMDIDGDVIRQGDIRLTLEKVSERPQVGWSCLVDSVSYRVMDVRKVRRAGSDVIYTLQLRV